MNARPIQRGPALQFLRFGVVGVAGFLVDLFFCSRRCSAGTRRACCPSWRQRPPPGGSTAASPSSTQAPRQEHRSAGNTCATWARCWAARYSTTAPICWCCTGSAVPSAPRWASWRAAAQDCFPTSSPRAIWCSGRRVPGRCARWPTGPWPTGNASVACSPTSTTRSRPTAPSHPTRCRRCQT